VSQSVSQPTHMHTAKGNEGFRTKLNNILKKVWGSETKFQIWKHLDW